MKFATIALIAGVSAVKINQMSSMLATKGSMNTASEIMDTCDASGNGKISQKEAVDCIMSHHEIPDSYRQHVVKAVKDMWPHLDKNGDGEVDMTELKAALGERGLAQKGGMNTPEEVMDKCDADDSGKISKEEAVNCIMSHHDIPEAYRQHVVKAVNDIWPHIDKDGDGEVDINELKAAMNRHGLAQKGSMNTASEVMDTCDADDNGKISKQEAVDCVMSHYEVPEEYRKHVVKAINDMWPHLDKNGDGEVDMNELKAAMGERGLAQKGGMNTPDEIMDACDADNSGKISKKEAVDCIMKQHNVPEEYRQHIVQAVNDIWPHIDADGDGEVDINELKAAMNRHGL
jgi:Ca2+-binding EF-hand superfamily protein